jgi:acetolactate synthase-1/2/3 large subunit
LPQTLLAHLRAALPPTARLVVDVGSHKIFSSLEWPTLTPNTFYLSNGLSSMAFSLPAAIGAHLAAPDVPTICLIGDAGMAMVIGELALLAAHALPILVVVLNDGAIDLIRAQQLRAGKPVYGTTFDAPNFAQIAAAYGLAAARITAPDQLESALHEFVGRPHPLLLEIMLDPISYPTTPPVTS